MGVALGRAHRNANTRARSAAQRDGRRRLRTWCVSIGK